MKSQSRKSLRTSKFSIVNIHKEDVVTPTGHKAYGTRDEEGNFDFRCDEDKPCSYRLSFVDGESHRTPGEANTYHTLNGALPELRTDRLEPFEDAVEGS